MVLKLIAATQDAGRVTVRIGEETQVERCRGTSVISTGYGTAGTVFGGVGVLGPTRMDYREQLPRWLPLPGTSAKYSPSDRARTGATWPGRDPTGAGRRSPFDANDVEKTRYPKWHGITTARSAVGPKASDQEIKRAYRKLARELLRTSNPDETGSQVP